MLIYCHKSFYSLQLHILIPAPLPSPSVPVEPTPDPAEACSVDPGHKPHRSGRVFISSLGRVVIGSDRGERLPLALPNRFRNRVVANQILRESLG